MKALEEQGGSKRGVYFGKHTTVYAKDISTCPGAHTN